MKIEAIQLILAKAAKDGKKITFKRLAKVLGVNENWLAGNLEGFGYRMDYADGDKTARSQMWPVWLGTVTKIPAEKPKSKTKKAAAPAAKS